LALTASRYPKHYRVRNAGEVRLGAGRNTVTEKNEKHFSTFHPKKSKTLVKLNVANIGTAIVAALVCNSLAQTHCPECPVRDRIATAEMQLKEINDGIAKHTSFIDQQNRNIRDKEAQIAKMEKQSGNLFASKIQSLREEIKESETSVRQAQQENNDLVHSKSKWEAALTKANNDYINILQKSPK
jgi:septal ring factor EnvC (AmiA/AmiB activator)